MDEIPRHDRHTLAEAVADGITIEWHSIINRRQIESPDPTVQQLRDVASVARLFERLSRASGRDTAPPLLAPGTTWGGLEIVEHVGHGRFGDVYRAWDPALDRHVALKILRQGDGTLNSQVVEEGRLMARVRHPNVITIHGAQRIDGISGLWMEFVEGQTLAGEMADRGPFPASEIIAIGIELCHALEAVHGAGLLHRDVKAQNVLRDTRGRTLLGDFGVGKEFDDTDSASGLAGTPAYIAPELLAHQPATPRSDIYSLGALLFYLATGTFPVTGRTLRELRDAHRQAPPGSVRSLRPDLPPALGKTIDRALECDPSRRFESASAMAQALTRAATGRVRTALVLTAAITVGAVVMTAEAVWRRSSGQSSSRGAAASAAVSVSADRVVRASIFPPPGTRFFFQNLSAMAVSPDGLTIAFTVISDEGPAGLWVQPTDGGAPRKLPIPGAPFNPFWSPDSEWIGFSTVEGLSTIHVATGASQLVCPAIEPVEPLAEKFRHGTWSREGIILFNAQREGPIYRASASGGSCTRVTTSGNGQERGHQRPMFLPDGQRFLYFSAHPDRRRRGLYVASLDSPGSTFVTESSPGSVFSATGHLLFVRDTNLMAAPFDPVTASLTGLPTVIAERLMFNASSVTLEFSHFSASQTGTLAYVEAGAPVTGYRWFDRTGRALEWLPEQGARGFPAISHDHRFVALEVKNPDSGYSDVWVYDLLRRVGRRITSHPSLVFNPHWAPDDKTLAFSSDRGAAGRDIYHINADGTNESLLFASPGHDDVTSWSGDGGSIVFNRPGQAGSALELWTYSIAERRAALLHRTTEPVYSARMSPDGRWVAYLRRHGSGSDLWIRGVPPYRGEQRIGSGLYPTWRSDSRELFHIEPAVRTRDGDMPASRMMAVSVGPAQVLSVEPSTTLFSLPPYTGNLYDAQSDGARFLIIATNLDALQNTNITLVRDWTKLLR